MPINRLFAFGPSIRHQAIVLACSICLCSMVSISFGQKRPQQKSLRPTVKLLLQEAESSQKDNTEQWNAFDKQVAEVQEKHRQEYANWEFRNPPPAPTIEALKLPLAYLTWHHVKSPDDSWLYLFAIVKSTDPRRIRLTLELAADDHDLSWAAVEAMPAARAGDVITTLLRNPPPFESRSVLYQMIARFADQINPQDRTAAYEYIALNWSQGPSNGDGEQFWRTLMKIDVKRARHEIIPYFAKKADRTRLDFYVLQILLEVPGESSEVADAVRGWLRTPRTPYIETQSHRLLFISDPQTELGRYVGYIDFCIAKVKPGQHRLIEQSTTISNLIQLLLELAPEQAIIHLRRYSTDERVKDDTRFLIAEHLVRTKDTTADEFVRNWLTDQRYYAKAWMRESLPQWGEYGAALAEKHAPLIAASREDRGKQGKSKAAGN
jgi:hypothetical protein